MKIFRNIKQNLLNILGWRTKRHIVVIESDDWGSIRIPSKEVYNKLLQLGIQVNKCHYCSYDTIATEDDLSLLFDVLNKYIDINGSPAVITANAVIANPDFVRIKNSNFQQYYYKKISDSFQEIKGCEHILNRWKEGIANGCFIVQSHGREHLNVNRWMYHLKNNYKETRLAFDLGVYGLSTSITSEKRKSYLPAFDFESSKEENDVNIIVKEGLKIFEEIFGYKSKSFIAPNYIWGKSLEKTLASCDVKYIQGQQIARYRKNDNEYNYKRLRYIGKKNIYGQIDLCRNSFFEPSSSQDYDWVDSCLADMKIVFNWHHPVIICSHRVNFIGAINKYNRDKNLKLLSLLLQRIKKQWPDVEFMSSDKLGMLISEDNERIN